MWIKVWFVVLLLYSLFAPSELIKYLLDHPSFGFLPIMLVIFGTLLVAAQADKFKLKEPLMWIKVWFVAWLLYSLFAPSELIKYLLDHPSLGAIPGALVLFGTLFAAAQADKRRANKTNNG